MFSRVKEGKQKELENIPGDSDVHLAWERLNREEIVL